jgi:enoyl-CoA hydratase/carnithine racemase
VVCKSDWRSRVCWIFFSNYSNPIVRVEQRFPMPQSQIREIIFEQDGAIATITLNRPQKLNAMTPEMADELCRLIGECNQDSLIRVAILTGAGSKAFCVGSDIKELDAYDAPWAFRNRLDYCDSVRMLRKPIVCAVNGYCLGGGLELAMACDIRVASENALFGAPEIKLGWVGGGGMAFGLAHSVGPSSAALMLLTGDAVNANQAATWGLVTQVLQSDRLMERARVIAAAIAQQAPIAAETAKLNLRAAYSLTYEEAIRYERDLQTICFATEDAHEGRAAFKEKRTPKFKGK